MKRQLDALITYLLNENPAYGGTAIPASFEDAFRLYRSLVNLREPQPIAKSYLEAEDAFLQRYHRQRGITMLTDLSPVEKNIYLWQGDITTLASDAIVNAANAQLLGCFSPCHACIDNAIHTFSGVRLRLKCAEIMRAQGVPEPTGKAKITPAYNLPSRYVLHTVGPIVNGALGARHKALLASCYEQCLELAEKNHLGSIAFCSISTGVFGFPKKEAAAIAVETVKAYQQKNDSEIKVIFNVFDNFTKSLYEGLLATN